MSDKLDNERFQLHMYDQMWNNINRHILTVWQSIGAIGAAISIYVLAEKELFNMDVAVMLVIFLSAWLLAHVYDAQAWYDRNIAIIQKIEKKFETKSDEFHGYTKQRNKDLITHLKIQRDLGILMVSLSIIFHFSLRVYPQICTSPFKLTMILPYMALLLLIVYTLIARKNWHKVFEKAYQNNKSEE